MASPSPYRSEPEPGRDAPSVPLQRSAKLHIPIRSVLDRKPEDVSPYQRVEVPGELQAAGEEGESAAARPSAWLSDEDLTPEEREMRRALRRRRYLFLGSIGLLLLLGLWFARPLGRTVKGWQARRLAREAETLLSGRDWARAYPLVRDAVSLSFNDPFVTRVMAEFQSRAGTPEALAWWTRVRELEPHVQSHRLRLAHAAIREQEFETAERALAGLPAAARETAAYCEVVTALELARGNLPAAAEALQRWRRLDPTSEFARLNSAIAQLSATTAPEVQYARETLQELSKSAAVGRAATRALVRDALARGEFAPAVALARGLADSADGAFEDRLLELDALVRSGDPFSGVRVKKAQEAAGEDPVRIVSLARWLFVQKRFSEAFGWLKTLPDSLRLRPPVAITLADATMSIRDWNGLDRSLRPQEWGTSEYLRLVYLARAAREQQRAEASQAWWKRALELAPEAAQRAALLRLVNSWGWRREAEELLAQMRLADPGDPAPLEALAQLYAASGQTRELLQVTQDRLAREPESVRARNDQTALWLLLGERLPEAHAAADRLAQERPDDPMVQSTRALSLLLRGRATEALAVLRRLPEPAPRQPGVALYMGLALAANQAAEAEEFFVLAEQRVLLPEERALLEKARSGFKVIK
ncbi:MAG: hypothetical protein JSR82_20175 [Verrucomicrobia bacterium]|nr:hypothetical protein [Verrucomicrobiota bacterium]